MKAPFEGAEQMFPGKRAARLPECPRGAWWKTLQSYDFNQQPEQMGSIKPMVIYINAKTACVYFWLLGSGKEKE